MDDVSLLDTVARATRLREGPAGVAAVLRAVYRAGSLRLQDAAREARLPLPVATAIRRELEKAGLLERKHGLALTERGRAFVETTLGLGVTHDVTCPACGGRGIVIPGELRGAVERLGALIADAPSVDVTLDQCPCTPETAILRALLMLRTGALEGRRVLVLGDDDSLSVAIGLVGSALGKGDLTRGVTVIESDPRRVGFLREAAAREAIAIEVVEHDLRYPLPDGLAGAFDTVATDPPYTLAGAILFLGRAAAALASCSASCSISALRCAPCIRASTAISAPACSAMSATCSSWCRRARPRATCRHGAGRSTPPTSIRASGSMSAHNAARRSRWARTARRRPSRR
jgi:hypothetical protein